MDLSKVSIGSVNSFREHLMDSNPLKTIDYEHSTVVVRASGARSLRLNSAWILDARLPPAMAGQKVLYPKCSKLVEFKEKRCDVVFEKLKSVIQIGLSLGLFKVCPPLSF